MNLLPREFLKDYKENCQKVGEAEARKVVRQRIVWRFGHAWYMKNRGQIERELESVR